MICRQIKNDRKTSDIIYGRSLTVLIVKNTILPLLFNFLQACEQDYGPGTEKQATAEFLKNVSRISEEKADDHRILQECGKKFGQSQFFQNSTVICFFSKPSWKINFLERVSAAFLTGLLTEIPSRILAELMTSAFPSRILNGKVCYFSTFMFWILTIKADGIRILFDWNTSEQ